MMKNQLSPRVLWFTGLPASGKTTLAQAWQERLGQRGLAAVVLDGDRLRRGLSADLGFSAEDRSEAVRRAACVAQLFHEAGHWVLVAQIAPLRTDRAVARAMLAPGNFVEVFCDAPLAVCEARDPKGLYRRARAGELSQFTGIDAPYEAPIEPELHLRTGELEVRQCLERLEVYFAFHAVLPR